MKKVLLLILSLLSFSSMVAADTLANCPPSLPDTHANFCSSFKASAVCHCVAMGLPRAACQDMHTLYSRMIGMFGSLERACAYQKETSAQTCIDDWKCYNNGNEDSAGRLCSSTGDACE